MFLKNPNLRTLVNSLENLMLSDQKFAFLLIGQDLCISLKDLVAELNKKQINFIGGVFPKLIHNGETSSNSVVIKMISSETVSIYFDTPQTFTTQFSDFTTNEFSTAYVLTSGMSSDISEHLRVLYTNLGNEVKFLGGGVGRINENDEGIIISNDGIYTKGTLVALTKSKTTTGSLHGWTKLFGPFVTTKAEKNFIKELNWENAFVVYQRFLEQTLDLKINRENFETNSIHFPFGIYRENAEYIVRDPMKVTEEGHLQCVGNIPENSLVDLLLMKKESFEIIPERLINLSIDTNKTVSDTLIFNCISRANHLKNDFYVELNSLTSEIKKHQNQMNLEGALSIGEIYSSGEGYPELLNKSIVLGFSYQD